MSSSRRTALQASGLVLAGAVAGGVLAATIGASASPSAAPSAPYAGGTYAAGPGAPGSGFGGPDGHGMRPFGPMATGTVTAVGSASVTVKSASGTKTYAVDANSDIDKNGEAKLSDLKAGDAVRFAVRPGTSTIAVLHAGDEAKDGPGFGRHHGPCPGMGGAPGTGPDGGSGTRPSPSATSTT
jgi:hypothetical protein